MNQIYIGDNLEVLKDEGYCKQIGMVDCIYADPPYNTGNTFSYYDKQDRTVWLSFMKQRLIAMKNILKNSGCIFISIDDKELAYLKVLCDEIFNEKNFVGVFITKQAQRSNAKHINTTHEYILCYAKDKSRLKPFKVKRLSIPSQKEMIQSLMDEIKKEFQTNGKEAAQKQLAKRIKEICLKENITWIKNYSCVDENGEIYFPKDLSTPGKPAALSLPEIGLELKPLKTRGWSSPEKFRSLYYEGNLVFRNGRPYEKHLLSDSEDSAPSILNFYSRQGSKDLVELGLRDLFDTPKPVALIKYLIQLAVPKNGIILDPFGGSGTTAQAVYELNEEENANRSYVLIQQKETMSPKSKPYAVCKHLSITPDVSRAMLYRITKFLSLHHGEPPTVFPL